jgi:hypothetical protein
MQANLQFIIPFLMLGVNICAQVLGCRYVKRLSLLISAFFGYGIGLVCLLITQLSLCWWQQISFSEFSALLIVSFIIYSVLSHWYFIFITLLETAIRTRLIIELSKSQEGLTEEELLARYDSRELIEIRIERLVRNGQIIYNGEKYYPGKPGLVLYGKFSELMNRIVPGEKQEA